MALELLRYGVFAVFLASVVVAVASWAIRTRRVHPFSAAGRLCRQISDPVIGRIEHWQVRRGGNPQAAPWWLVGGVLVGGILLISVSEWLVFQAMRVAAAGRGGPRGVVRLVVYYAGQLVLLAIIVRVIASWLGAFRYSPWLRPAYLLTDWLIEPLRKVIPPLGMFDITPIVAWLLFRFLLGWLMRVL